MRRAVLGVSLLGFVLVQPALAARSSISAKPTKPSASAVTIAATPNPAVFGASTTIAGRVTGKHSGGVAVSLETKPFPYTGGFTRAATAKADAAGHYSFKIVPSLNALYNVVAKASPTATSANVLVKVRVKLTLGVSTSKPATGQRVRFRGFVLPAYNGQAAQIQRKTATRWKTVSRAKLVAATPVGGVARSKYSKRLRISSSGPIASSSRPRTAAGSRTPVPRAG
jgi:hypothetical protein